MKNITLSVVAFFAIISCGFAQDTIQSITRLAIDSTLTVGDSASFNSTMTIRGTTEMQQAATARNDLRVEGNLILPFLPVASSAGLDILFSDPVEGKTYRGTSEYLLGVLYDPKSCTSPGGIYYNPTWSNGPNKIFVECPEIKVGIGTSSPTHHLTNFGDSKLYGHTWFASSASIGADNDNFSRFYIKNTSYNAGLHINSSANNNAYNKLLFFEYSLPTTEIMKVRNTALNYDAFVLNSSGAMTINNGNYIPFDLKADGQLIMRNGTQKTFQFDVNGHFRARRVRVDADNWADFVFDANYQLMPLPEVKAYVEENKHLPGVPSEQEVAENGIDIAEMNTILLQKVEELMLHLIDQNETVTELKTEIEALKAKIAVLEGKQ